MKTIKNILHLLILAIIVACGEGEISKEIRTEANQRSNTIELTDRQFKLGEMQLGSFTVQTFHRVVKANGVLDVPPENKSTVSVYFGGYVKYISLLQGQKIAKGQTLFTLENPDYIQVQQDFLESKSLLSYFKSDYERQKELATSNVSSQKTYLKAESDYKVILVRYESLKKKLQLMNINPGSVTESNLSSTIIVKAPISGFVTSVSATKGMFLNPSDIALTIMNTDHMHIELNIFEQDLSKVTIGQEVSFSFQNDRKTYRAEVLLINKAIDPDKRTVKVLCHFLDKKEAQTLTPGMFVEAEIFVSSHTALALPINAVVTLEKKAFILLRKTKSKGKIDFEKIRVEVGQTNKEYVEILHSSLLPENSLFLTNGAFNLIQE
jgi:cobalt-zinc-cadmium efflux system membrane fusion protein